MLKDDAHQKWEPLALRPREAAKALGIGERLLWEMTQNGQVPCVQLSKRITVYPVNVLNDWLAKLAASNQSEPEDHLKLQPDER
ncbi:MAG: helix-turn-helix domain-containing protein [Phycisphaerales bacterium]|nr:helix-turn-helix domain-containing protein [Phycisphaerales bacterium]